MKKYTFEITRKNRYNKNVLLEVISTNTTIKGVLLDLKLKPVQTNYKTLYKHATKHGLDLSKFIKGKLGKIEYNEGKLIEISKKSNSLTDMLRLLGIRTAGGNYKTLKRYIEKFNIDISHFNPDKIRVEKLNNFNRKNKKSLESILKTGSTYNNVSLKKRLYDEGLKERKCELCGQDEYWFGKKISLILDHINGVHSDNRIENLRIVCPNCNATLETHCGKNNSKRSKKLRENGFSVNDEVDFRFYMTNNRLTEFKQMRKVERPPYEQLIKEIEELGYTGTGRKYGVSDNAIRKWKKFYEKYNPD